MLSIVVIALIFFAVVALAGASADDQQESQRTILERIIYQADASLLLAERNTISELLTNKALQQFYSNRAMTVAEEAQTRRSLRELEASLPVHSSIYLYDHGAQRVISAAGIRSLYQFPDQAYILDHYRGEITAQWTGPRFLREGDEEGRTRQVVSLMRVFADAPSKRGAIIINVDTDALERKVNTFIESAAGSVELLYGASDGGMTSEGKEAVTSTLVRSEYTGWMYRWKNEYLSGYVPISPEHRRWAGVALLPTTVALVFLTMAVRRRPGPGQPEAAESGFGWETAGRCEAEERIAAEAILAVRDHPGQLAEQACGLPISGARGQPDGRAGAGNVMTIAPDEMCQEALDPKSSVQPAAPTGGVQEAVPDDEWRSLQSQRLDYDLLTGHVMLTEAQYISRLSELQLPHRYDRIGVFLAEIDGQAAFAAQYPARDRQLFRYAMEQSLQEAAGAHGLSTRLVWMTSHRLACVLHLRSPEQEPPRLVAALADEWQGWVQQYLRMSVSIGIGTDAKSVETIAASYRSAQDNLSLKPVFGAGARIDDTCSSCKRSLDSYADLQALEQVARSLRMMEADWQGKLVLWFKALREGRVTKQDLTMLIHSAMVQMEKEVTVLPANIQHQWKEAFIPRFAEMKEHVETLDELEVELIKEWSAFAQVLEEEREARRPYHLAMQAKAYVDRHFTEPSLSLAAVSSALQVRPSALSQIFKEELGVKFVDYVIQSRLEHAKRMLAETDEPIQSIAEQSGYPNHISFYRAFKKVLNIPPGEYRNVYRMQ
ncbi:hypothetical protein PA598K_02662 [Paenibacillus sp. 598K]|nr:hypothetical protein PA598K_02662 [Paenibacillus sp. 598K]